MLLALAYREGQAPDALVAALGDAVRAARAERLAPAPLSRAEAAALCGGDRHCAALRAQRRQSVLSRAARPSAARGGSAATLGPGGAGIPAAVAAALAGELDALPGEARRVLDAAAVAGEPFEPELVADVADLGEEVTLAALDALLEPALIRPTATPRRFAFRHPLIRHAVYAAAPGAWRLHAHARAAAALARRGAGPVERAHHVEHAARRGDRAAIDLLADAAAGCSSRPRPRRRATSRALCGCCRTTPTRRTGSSCSTAGLRAVRRRPAPGGRRRARRDAGAASGRRAGAARVVDLRPRGDRDVVGTTALRAAPPRAARRSPRSPPARLASASSCG